MLLTQITTRLADLLNFSGGGGRNYSQKAFKETRSLTPLIITTGFTHVK